MHFSILAFWLLVGFKATDCYASHSHHIRWRSVRIWEFVLYTLYMWPNLVCRKWCDCLDGSSIDYVPFLAFVLAAVENSLDLTIHTSFICSQNEWCMLFDSVLYQQTRSFWLFTFSFSRYRFAYSVHVALNRTEPNKWNTKIEMSWRFCTMQMVNVSFFPPLSKYAIQRRLIRV